MKSSNVVLNINDLVDFESQPFKVFDDDAMYELVESINSVGVLVPIIVRSLQDGKYEIVSGHRRKRACELANINVIPAVIKELDDAEAAIMLVDSNLQRENILPSERAYAYKLKYEAQKCQGKRMDITSGTECRKFDKSERQIRYYIRLTNLVDALLNKVDEGMVSIKAGAELSYLNVPSQSKLNDYIEKELCSVSEAQAKKIKELYTKNQLSEYEIHKILCDGSEKEKVYLDTQKLRSYFPKDYSMERCKEELWKILDSWFEKV